MGHFLHTRHFLWVVLVNPPIALWCSLLWKRNQRCESLLKILELVTLAEPVDLTAVLLCALQSWTWLLQVAGSGGLEVCRLPGDSLIKKEQQKYPFVGLTRKEGSFAVLTYMASSNSYESIWGPSRITSLPMESPMGPVLSVQFLRCEIQGMGPRMPASQREGSLIACLC